jgi:hypothetical protein
MKGRTWRDKSEADEEEERKEWNLGGDNSKENVDVDEEKSMEEEKSDVEWMRRVII